MVLGRDKTIGEVLRSFYTGRSSVTFNKGLSQTHNDVDTEFASDMENMQIANGAVEKRAGSVCLNDPKTPVRYLLLDAVTVATAKIIIAIKHDRTLVAYSRYYPEKEFVVKRNRIDRNDTVYFTRGNHFWSDTIGNRFVIINEYGDSYTIMLDGVFKIAKETNSETYYPDGEYSRDKDYDYVLYLDVYNSTNETIDEFTIVDDPMNDTPLLKGDIRVATINEMGVVSKLSDAVTNNSNNSICVSLVDADFYKPVYINEREVIDVGSGYVQGSDFAVKYIPYSIIGYYFDDEKYTDVDGQSLCKVYYASDTVKTVRRLVTAPDVKTGATAYKAMLCDFIEVGYTDSGGNGIVSPASKQLVINSNLFGLSAITALSDAMANYNSTDTNNVLIRLKVVGVFDPLTADGTVYALSDIKDTVEGETIYVVAALGDDQDYAVTSAELKSYQAPGATGTDCLIDETSSGASLMQTVTLNVFEIFGGDIDSYMANMYKVIGGSSSSDKVLVGKYAIVEFEVVSISSGYDFINAYPILFTGTRGNALLHNGYDTWIGKDENFSSLIDYSYFIDSISKVYVPADTMKDTMYFFNDNSYFTDKLFVVWNDNYIVSKNQRAMVQNDEIVYDVYDGNYQDKALTSGGTADARVVNQAPITIEFKNIAVTKPVYQSLRRIAHKYNPAEEVITSATDIAFNKEKICVIQGNRVWVGSSYTLLLDSTVDIIGDVVSVSSLSTGFVVFSSTGVTYIDNDGQVQQVEIEGEINTLFVNSTSDGNIVYALSSDGSVYAVFRREVMRGVYTTVATKISSRINTVRFSSSAVMKAFSGVLYIADDDILYSFENGIWKGKWVFTGKKINKIAILDGEVVISFVDYIDSSIVDMSEQSEGM